MQVFDHLIKVEIVTAKLTD